MRSVITFMMLGILGAAFIGVFLAQVMFGNSVSPIVTTISKFGALGSIASLIFILLVFYLVVLVIPLNNGTEKNSETNEETASSSPDVVFIAEAEDATFFATVPHQSTFGTKLLSGLLPYFVLSLPAFIFLGSYGVVVTQFAALIGYIITAHDAYTWNHVSRLITIKRAALLGDMETIENYTVETVLTNYTRTMLLDARVVFPILFAFVSLILFANNNEFLQGLTVALLFVYFSPLIVDVTRAGFYSLWTEHYLKVGQQQKTDAERTTET